MRHRQPIGDRWRAAELCDVIECSGTLGVTEGWLEIDKHYSLELYFSIEKQPEIVCLVATKGTDMV